MYNDVLLATDGSEPASAATQYALDVAEQYGATLHALFVIDTNTSWLTVSKSEVHDVLRDLGEDASRAVLEDVETAAADADVDLTTEVVEGAPDDRIVEYVRRTTSTSSSSVRTADGGSTGDCSAASPNGSSGTRRHRC